MPDALTLLAASGAIAAAAVAALLAAAPRLPHAHPSARSLHQSPVPRVGGLAIWAAALPIALVEPPAISGFAALWLAAWASVVAVSLVDDWRGVSVRARLAVHIAAALALSFPMLADRSLPIAIPAIAVAALLLTWGMNLFNFMDGSDGLAATMTITGFAAYACAFALRGEPWIACGALVVAAAVFLAVNRPAARMFLGDVGAVPLGLVAAGLGFDRVASGAWPWWFPLLAFLPFVLDATVTIVRRLLRGERVFEAHRSHYYQRLLQLGFGHAGTLAVYASLMAACALAAVGCLARAPEGGPTALAALAAVHAILFATIDYHWAKQAESFR